MKKRVGRKGGRWREDEGMGRGGGRERERARGEMRGRGEEGRMKIDG